MSHQTYICEDCGNFVTIGEWPFCPHGFELHGMHSFKAYTDHSIDEQPVRITSYAQKKALMKKNNLDHRQVGVGMPGCEV